LTRIDNLKKDIQLCVFEKDDKMYLWHNIQNYKKYFVKI
jgi:hypothetical protein